MDGWMDDRILMMMILRLITIDEIPITYIHTGLCPSLPSISFGLVINPLPPSSSFFCVESSLASTYFQVADSLHTSHLGLFFFFIPFHFSCASSRCTHIPFCSLYPVHNKFNGVDCGVISNCR